MCNLREKLGQYLQVVLRYLELTEFWNSFKTSDTAIGSETGNDWPLVVVGGAMHFGKALTGFLYAGRMGPIKWVYAEQ